MWYKVCKCLGWELVLKGIVLCLFQLIESHGERARGRLCFVLIWHAVVWTFWKAHNGFIFAGKPVEVEPLVDQIHFLSWKLLFGRHPGHHCSLYELQVELVSLLEPVEVGVGDRDGSDLWGWEGALVVPKPLVLSRVGPFKGD